MFGAATADRDRTKLSGDPFKAIVAPRPSAGSRPALLYGRINPAPMQLLQRLLQRPRRSSASPAKVGRIFASFAKESGEFVANLATFDLLRADERNLGPVLLRGDIAVVRVGLTMAKCRLVAAPRVAESPAALECKVVEVVEIRSVGGEWSGACADAPQSGRLSHRR